MNLPTLMVVTGLPVGLTVLIFGWISILTLVMP